MLDLLFGAFVFAEHVEFGKLVAADPLHVETLFQRISFEFFQCLLHIGDRLADVVGRLRSPATRSLGRVPSGIPIRCALRARVRCGFGLESVEFVFYGFDRIVVVHQLPDVVGVERRAEQGVARSRKNAVRKGDVFLGPLRVPACEFAYQKVQRVLAAVEVSGFPALGERRVQ